MNDYIPNESEKAKQELMHIGVLGMKWGRRKDSSESNKRITKMTFSDASAMRAKQLMERKRKEKIYKIIAWSPIWVPAAAFVAKHAYNAAYIGLKVGMVKAVDKKHAVNAAREAARQRAKILRIGSGIGRVIDSKFVGG